MARRLAWVAFALLALMGTLRADIPPGPHVPLPLEEPLPPLPPQFARPKANKVRLVFRFDGPDSQTRVRLPGKLLKDLPNEAPAQQRDARLPPTSGTLIVAGVALTAAFVTAGMWLTRGRDRRVLGGGVLVVAVVLISVSGCPQLDPSSPETVEPAHVGSLTTISGALVGYSLLERDDASERVDLFVNGGDLANFCDQAGKPR